jgi:hypothetical protein
VQVSDWVGTDRLAYSERGYALEVAYAEPSGQVFGMRVILEIVFFLSL